MFLNKIWIFWLKTLAQKNLAENSQFGMVAKYLKFSVKLVCWNIFGRFMGVKLNFLAEAFKFLQFENVISLKSYWQFLRKVLI